MEILNQGTTVGAVSWKLSCKVALASNTLGKIVEGVRYKYNDLPLLRLLKVSIKMNLSEYLFMMKQ